MMHSLYSLAATGQTDSGAIDVFKDWINALSVPQISLPFFFLPLFILMFVLYKQWTKPVVFSLLAVVFLIAYFGSMAIDANYFSILAKADNVPISMMLIGTGFCLWMAFRQAASNDRRLAAGEPLVDQDKDDKVLVWPDLVYEELICIVLATVVLVVWSILLRAPLEAPANPAGPPNPSKAPWYFLGLQEMLVYFDPWMAGVILPGLILSGLITLPYIDINPKGNGYYTLRDRPFAIVTWLFGFLILWVVLIVFGTFLRGPNWNFFGPYEYWDATKQVPLTNVHISHIFWIRFLDMARPENMYLRELPGIILVLGWVFVLPVILARTIMRSLYQKMGPARFYVMAFHLVIMGMLPIKMILRWLLNLKYFINLTEINFNL